MKINFVRIFTAVVFASVAVYIALGIVYVSNYQTWHWRGCPQCPKGMLCNVCLSDYETKRLRLSQITEIVFWKHVLIWPRDMSLNLN